MPKIVENALVLYTDGSCYQRSHGRTGGFGIAFLHFDELGNETLLDTYVAPSVKGTTNQVMELEAAVTALKMAQRVPCFDTVAGVVIRTDSRYVSNNYFSAFAYWRANKWRNVHGKAMDNAELWRDFHREYGRIKKPVSIEWVKRRSDSHAILADNLAKESRDSALRRRVFRSTVRRKLSPKETEPGSIGVRGQNIALRVIEAKPMRLPKTTKYRCEVISADSPYFECIDFLYSTEDLRPAHSYEVRLNNNPKNPTIVEKVRDIGSEEHSETATDSGDAEKTSQNN